MNVAFVLLSYRRDAPAGMERSVAALASGLRQRGHRPLVLTAAADPGDPHTLPLPDLRLTLPSDDEDLRRMLRSAPSLEADLAALYLAHGVDLVCYVDALWGLGARAPRHASVRSALMVHVIGDGPELRAALDREPDAVTVPSATVLRQATAKGYDAARWAVVPNGLLATAPAAVPAAVERDRLRRSGPVRLAARLGPEKGIVPFLQTAPAEFDRPVEVALAEAGFEVAPGGQQRLLADCVRVAASHPAITLCGPLRWAQVASFFARAAVAVVPSTAETFGLVALEAASVGTPVVTFAVGNLPDLLGDAAELVPSAQGASGLWRATESLLADRGRYAARSAAGLALGPAHDPAALAEAWLTAVRA